MSFYKTSDGQAVGASTSYESGGGDFAPIPAKTRVLASVEEASTKEYEGERYINLKWRVLKPDEYAKRVLFQKVKVWGTDPSKRDSAIKMLVAIDTNASGGKLVGSGQEPNDQNLQVLIGMPMVLELDVWEMNGKTGNWVRAVSARASGGQQQQQQAPAPAPAPVAAPAPAAAPAPGGNSWDVDNDPIPF